MVRIIVAYKLTYRSIKLSRKDDQKLRSVNAKGEREVYNSPNCPIVALSCDILEQFWSTYSLADHVIFIIPESASTVELRLHPPRQKELRQEYMAKQPKKSPYFPKKRSNAASCLPFPPISAQSFGLIQEKLAHDPFRLLIATIFLNRTRGEVAIPVLYSVFERYPTITALAEAQEEDVIEMIRCLGFQNARARKCIALAKLWVENPPVKGKRYRKLHYPNKGDGRDIKPRECVEDDDTRAAWEIAHLPGLGSYAIDSWRIFCRDELRGLANDWKGTGASGDFVPEWKSVVPRDKELRGYLTWMWLKEGWEWEKETGSRRRASKKLRRAALKGGIAVETNGSWILESSMVETSAYFEKTIQDK